ncbi:MFS transporter [Jiangella alba]|uniref:Transmembrane secretion effector n=1 Tax=Jiangella alba TaxID=561176 RepID=A0A1H5C6U1_9ACTN|nr:MFS transporter [Jiangella alba]SED62512.1 Transmembrane secretion effector [Jiangella alba]
MLIGGLLVGSLFRLAGSSSRRLLATSMAVDDGRFAVNGLLGLNTSVALYVVGPVLGGIVVASAGAGVALLADAAGTLDAGASALGLLWGALGVGAFVGAPIVNQLRHLPQRHLLVAIVALWGLCPIALSVTVRPTSTSRSSRSGPLARRWPRRSGCWPAGR